MSYSNIVSTISLFVSAAAFALPYWRDHKAKKKAKRKEMLDLFTSSGWHNEGDICAIPKAYYTLEINKSSGISNTYGTFYINFDSSQYEFNGTINAKGVLSTTLRIPIGKHGVNIAKVKFVYSEENDEITYIFEGFVGEEDWAKEHSVLDTTQKLWRLAE